MQVSNFSKILFVVINCLIAPCVAGDTGLFKCKKWPYCAYKDLITTPLNYNFGWATLSPNSDSWTCKDTPLRFGVNVNACCENFVGMDNNQIFLDPVIVWENDFINTLKCTEVPNTG
ncbi:hypothetical protein PSHT_03544 [Puccinia striiformis]|uniref:Secreted protein n=2 Tax=Puccinia striiformis TaxID=27350 RepID=A0A2S4W0I8_9BASI|nr:hypothetical protein Pst134EB_023793 [Puccinia striiformis f. sp. tritici]KAI9606082.1 hypothetical protein H4Q26_004456 [Puccinia striiformis f. sp. tritici PST-130]POW15272.1 hypothetical protein PSTT_02213 [Puccinia striiformis]POW20474.1 hypothetical protein PSHT_03544 [Puccinia striiformis]